MKASCSEGDNKGVNFALSRSKDIETSFNKERELLEWRLRTGNNSSNTFDEFRPNSAPPLLTSSLNPGNSNTAKRPQSASNRPRTGSKEIEISKKNKLAYIDKLAVIDTTRYKGSKSCDSSPAASIRPISPSFKEVNAKFTPFTIKLSSLKAKKTKVAFSHYIVRSDFESKFLRVYVDF